MDIPVIMGRVAARLRPRLLVFLLPLSLAGILAGNLDLRAQGETDTDTAQSIQASFAKTAKPFLDKNCMACHQGDNAPAALRVDRLTGAMDEQHMETWERVYRRVANGTMPPASARQPSPAERQQMQAWMDHAFAFAATRPTPRNGLVRRLTVAQYRNTLRDLLKLDDDVAEALPPDALSREGFLNNQELLELSPQLLNSYLEVADRALGRVIVNPAEKPVIENFRLDFGAGINRAPIQDRLILGPANTLLEPENFTVTQLTPQKPFAFKPFRMQTKLRFVEGYVGNATVRGWKDFNSIYHAVFADLRGSRGYPKGRAWDTVPEGLLLRPAIPSETINGSEGFGPKANFKIALRELPDDGKFRITITAAKYDDGLLLDPGARSAAQGTTGAVTVTPASPMAYIKQDGIYQVDVYPPAGDTDKAVDGAHLAEGLVGNWTLDGPSPEWKLLGETTHVATPFGKGVHFNVETDAVAVPYSDRLAAGTGAFTVSGWIKLGGGATRGIISARGDDGPGWVVESNSAGGIQFLSYGANGKLNGKVVSDNGLFNGGWKHFAVAIGRGANQARLYIDGVLVGQGTIGGADLTYKGNILIGASPGQESFVGELGNFRYYNRALLAAEIRALAVPGVELPKPPPSQETSAPEVVLKIGGRQFSGNLRQPAFLLVRLAAGRVPVEGAIGTLRHASKIVLTPLAPDDGKYKRFAAFEKRIPRIGLYMGFRRDCGDTMVSAGAPQDVPGTNLRRYVFEGAIRNFPNPEVDAKDANYISGVRQIGIHSEYTDGRDMPRLLIRSVEFEGPYYDHWPSAAYANIFGAAKAGTDADKARQIIRNFASRAFRRPVTATEEDKIFAVYRASAGSGRGYRESVKDALVATLSMPQFLFLVEKSASSAPEPLDDYELASKLSYFLWNAPPDQQTLRLASAGKLHRNLDSEIGRMIASPKFSGFLKEFVAQWLTLDKFQVLEPDRGRFPDLTHVMRANLMQEPVEYVRYLIAKNLPVRDLISSDFVVVNEAVAGYYGLGGKVDSGFQFVAIKPNRPDLGGVMTQAAILSGLSDGRESNPVKRGAWLARKIIAQPPPNPPPNVPPLQEDTKGLTLRQRIEQHRSSPLCGSCHSRIDPWGVAFEDFDASGRLKKAKADSQSRLPDGTSVDGVDGLKQYLAGPKIDDVAFSVLKHLATYAAGRSLSYSELAFLRRDSQKLKAGQYRMQDMIRYVAESPLFLEK